MTELEKVIEMLRESARKYRVVLGEVFHREAFEPKDTEE